MNFLTKQDRELLKTQHKQERDGRVRDRIKAVLLTDEGWTSQQIAKVLLITDQAVREHIREYQASHKLKPESGGSGEKLSKEQSEQLIAHLETHTYLYVKDIAAYVEAMFKVVYTVPGMRHWLKRHRFSYKKPAVVPGKANKEQQQQWLSEVKLHFLPPYSPNLNPIERLWKWMKERILYNTYYEHFEEFRAAIMGFFAVLSTVKADSTLGQMLRCRVRDILRPLRLCEF